MIKNGIYNFIGGLVRLGLSIATVPFLIQILGLDQYGLYVLINAILSFAMLSEWSIATSMTVFLAPTIELDKSNKLYNQVEVMKASVIVIAIISIVTVILLEVAILLLPVFFVAIPSDEVIIISTCCQLGVLLVWVRLLQQFFIGIEQANQQYGPSNIINTILGLIISVGTLLMAFFTCQLLPIFYFQFTITALGMVAHGWYCFRKKLISIRFLQSKVDKAQIIEMMQYSLKAWTGSLGSILFTQGDRLLVGNLLGSHVVGIYAALTSITSQINNISAMPLQTIIPELSQAQDQIKNIVKDYGNWSYNPQKIISAYLINLFLALLLGAGVIGLAPEALLLLSLSNLSDYDSVFLTQAFIFLGIIYTMYSTNALGFYILLALRETSLFLNIQLWSGSIAIATIGWFSYTYGLSGAIAGNSVYLLVSFFTWFSAKKLSISIGKFIRVSILPFCLFALFTCICIMNATLMIRLISLTIFTLYAGWQLIEAVQTYKLSKFTYQNSLI